MLYCCNLLIQIRKFYIATTGNFTSKRSILLPHVISLLKILYCCNLLLIQLRKFLYFYHLFFTSESCSLLDKKLWRHQRKSQRDSTCETTWLCLPRDSQDKKCTWVNRQQHWVSLSVHQSINASLDSRALSPLVSLNHHTERACRPWVGLGPGVAGLPPK